MPHRLFSCITCLLLLSLVGCENYDFKVNEQVVYTPPVLFRDFSVADPALGECLTQAIADQGATQASELTELICSHAGISDLTGLSTFTALVRLKLSSNRIRNLLELPSLGGLQVLQLDDNRVVDPVPLYKLGELLDLDLSKNPTLQCPDRAALAHVPQLTLPEHCAAVVADQRPDSPRR